MKRKLLPLLICFCILTGCGDNTQSEAMVEEPVSVPGNAGDSTVTDASDSPMIIAPEAETSEESEYPQLVESKDTVTMTPEPESPDAEELPELPLFFGGPFLHIENGDGREMHLENLYRSGTEQEMTPENRSYALVDLDGDGVDEVVLSLAMGNSEYPYGFEILHECEKMGDYPMPFGYPVNLRAFHDLCTDGTFQVSGGAYDWKICKIESFDQNGFTTRTLMGRASHTDENGEMIFSFFIGEESCSEEELLDAVEERNATAERVKFFSLGMKSYKSSFVVEDEGEYTLSNGLRLGLSYNEIKELIGPPQMKETMELEVANFYKLFYRGLGVLTLCAYPGESIEDASLLCIQVLERGTETAHGIEVGADLKTLREAGMEPTEENGFFDFNFPTIASGDTMAYDGTVEIYNGFAGIEEGRHLFYMMSDGLVGSILIRPAVALDAFPPVYPPLLGDSISLNPNDLVGEKLGELERVTVKSCVNNGGERLLEYENTLSNFQMTMLTQLFAELSVQQLSAPPEVQMNDCDRNYEITLHFSDGESSVFQTADEGALIYYGEGDVWFAGKSEAIKEFLATYYRWSKYDLSFMAW